MASDLGVGFVATTLRGMGDQLVRKLHDWARRRLPEPWYAAMGTVTGRLLRRGGPGIVAIRKQKCGWLLSCTDGELVIASARRLALYRRGLRARLDQVRDKYLNGLMLLPSDVVVDGGANIGEFSLAIASSVREVVAVEPDSLCYSVAVRNLHGRTNVRVVHELLLDRVREVTFYEAPEGADSSIFRPSPRSQLRMAMRLDDVLSALGVTPTVIKLDAEGAEPEVLRGAAQALRHVRMVAVDVGPERHGERTRDETSTLLQQAGLEARPDLGSADLLVATRQ